MDLHLKVILVCISGIFLVQLISCENPLDGSGPLNWTCICESVPPAALNNTPASNCSTSCACVPDGTGGPEAGGRWNCSCASERAPQQPGNIQNASCFTSCNCTAGSSGARTSARKLISNKSFIAILLLCAMLTIISFLVSLACYFCRKDRPFVQSPMFSSEKSSSWSSAANLISHRSASFPQNHARSNSGCNPITGFIHKLLFIFGGERGTLPGAVVQFSYAELEQATEKFSNSNLIGVGGSSNVYRGQLNDGRFVAVKKLRPMGGPEADSEFLYEIELLSRLNHCHVVPLLGYCLEFQGRQYERLLVFEYMSNGNLRDCLNATHGKEPMDWETRVCIALGAARGLEYLHEAAAPRILHRDIKSTNILLDDNYRAKITDLGMAKRLSTDDHNSCSSSPARMLGTFGYFAPEYAIVGKASLKSDVFSFGVVILELITGRQPIHKSSNKGDESLVIWATARLRDSKLVVSELPDPLLKRKFPEEDMQIMAHLARECLQWDPDSRPSMSDVVQILLTIAPNKSKRRSISTSFFIGSSSRNIKSVQESERPEGSVVRQELGQAGSESWQYRCSLPLAVDCNLSEDHQKRMETALSAQHMERLILLTSNAQSWRANDDETVSSVDLTEPRFESFMDVNLQSL